MERHVLDDLAVPRPPYRMPRPPAGRAGPTAVFAAAEELPPSPAPSREPSNPDITQEVSSDIREELQQAVEHAAPVQPAEPTPREEMARLSQEAAALLEQAEKSRQQPAPQPPAQPEQPAVVHGPTPAEKAAMTRLHTQALEEDAIREKVKQEMAAKVPEKIPEQEQWPDFSTATTFEEVYALLRVKGRFLGTGDQVQPTTTIISAIERMREWVQNATMDSPLMHALLNEVPKGGGLRMKVLQLVNQEAVRQKRATPPQAEKPVEHAPEPELPPQPRPAPEPTAEPVIEPNTEPVNASGGERKEEVHREQFPPIAQAIRDLWESSQVKFELDSFKDKALAELFGAVRAKNGEAARRARAQQDQHKVELNYLESAPGGITRAWRVDHARRKMLAAERQALYYERLQQKWGTKQNHRLHEIADRIDVQLRPYEERARDCGELAKDAAHMLKRWDDERDRLTARLAATVAEGRRMGSLFGLIMSPEVYARVDALKRELANVEAQIRDRRTVLEKMNARRVSAEGKATAWKFRKAVVLGSRSLTEMSDQRAARTQETV